MHVKQARLRALIFLLTITFILVGTFATIRYAQGYRPTLSGTVKGTGLLNANSFPTGAEVYINGRLTTATDTTLNLDPGEYEIELKKDGYHSWKKNITLEPELVVQTNAQLFPTSPTLTPLTYTGAISPIPAPGGSQLAFAVASASANTKNGLYIQDLSGNFSIRSTTRQIARSEGDYTYHDAKYTYSPNGSELLVSFPSGSNLLLSTSTFNDPKDLRDATARLPQILRDWEEELARSSRVEITKLPLFFQESVFPTEESTSSALTNLYFAPDGTKLLYQAQAELTIPKDLIPAIPSRNTFPEDRELKSGHYYVYDLKEDRNYLIFEPAEDTESKTEKILLLENLAPIVAELGSSPSAYRRLQNERTTRETISFINAQYSPIGHFNIQWYPDSAHLIVTSENSIEIMEYDGQNKATVYAGPFDPSFVYPWPDGSRLVTRIQFSPETTPNLYTIKLK